MEKDIHKKLKPVYSYIIKNIHLKHYPHLIALFANECKGDEALDFLKELNDKVLNK